MASFPNLRLFECPADAGNVDVAPEPASAPAPALLQVHAMPHVPARALVFLAGGSATLERSDA